MNAALTRAASMHHDDKWYSTLKHYAALKGLSMVLQRRSCLSVVVGGWGVVGVGLIHLKVNASI